MTSNRFNTPYSRQIALWLLRALSRDVAFFLTNNDGSMLIYGNSPISEFLGLPSGARLSDLRTIRDKMTNLLAELETTTLPVGLPQRADAGFDELALYFELNPVEAALAKFLACAGTEVLIAELQRLAWHTIADCPARYFSRVLTLPLQQVADALLPKSRLSRSGLLRNGSIEWSEKTTPVFSATELAHQIMLECPILAIAHPLSSLWTMDETAFNGFRVPPLSSDRARQRNFNWPDDQFPN